MEERYRNGGGAQKPENIYSITKTLCALGALSAVSKGWLKLDEDVSSTIPEWQRDPRKKHISARDLLSQTSGLSPGYDTLYSRQLKNKERALLKLPSVNQPGTSFAYGPSHYEAMETLLARKLKQPPLEWIKGSVLGPIGVTPARWRSDTEGHPFFSAGAQLTARDLLAVGQVIRRNGVYWIFPVVPKNLLQEALSGSEANPMYGLGFWLNHNAAKPVSRERDVEEAIGANLSAGDWAQACLSRCAPSDLIAMVGSYGQRVYVVPSCDLVIVRLGSAGGFRDPDFLQAFFR